MINDSYIPRIINFYYINNVMSYSFLLNLGSGVKIDKDSMLQCICSVEDQISGTQGSAECVAYVLITFCDLSLYRGTVPWNLFILNDKKNVVYR